MTYQETLAYIHNINWCFCKPGLERTRTLCEKLLDLGAKKVVLTGASPHPGTMGAACHDGRAFSVYAPPRVQANYDGTGDLFASVLLGGLLHGRALQDAAHLAADFTRSCVEVSLKHGTDPHHGVDFEGLCFVNLVDFDMLFGHRRDVDGYAKALSEFDAWLGTFMEKLGDEDLVMITADHGCDPAYTATTDHTREYVPLLILGKQVRPGNLGTRHGFCDIAATVADLLDVKLETPGKSFAEEIIVR